MKTINNDDAAPQYSMGAAIDAQTKHKEYWPLHTFAKQVLAHRLRLLAYAAYGVNGSTVYLNAREKFITVKIDKPRVSTTWLYATELASMNTFVKSHRIEVLASKRNLLFRIPK